MWVGNAHFKTYIFKPSNKTLKTRHEKPFLTYQSVLPKRLPNTIDYSYHPWLPPEMDCNSLLLMTLCTSDMGPENMTWIDLKASSLRTRFHFFQM